MQNSIFKPLALCLFVFFLLGMVSCAPALEVGKNQPEIVEASCGTCNFAMKGEGCELAVKIADKSYFVRGTGLNDHGDAHSADGFCSTVRKAKVQGKVKGGYFVADFFELMPVEK